MSLSSAIYLLLAALVLAYPFFPRPRSAEPLPESHQIVRVSLGGEGSRDTLLASAVDDHVAVATLEPPARRAP